ncbi:MAG: tetratricopeptide repeat protein, partial [Desulfosarcinaceae bacterium]
RGKINARAEMLYRRGVKHFLNEELELAIKDWKETLKLNPNHPKAAQDIENAERLLQKWRGLEKPEQ